MYNESSIYHSDVTAAAEPPTSIESTGVTIAPNQTYSLIKLEPGIFSTKFLFQNFEIGRLEAATRASAADVSCDTPSAFE